MRIVIVDDEKAQREWMITYVKDYMTRKQVHAEIESYESSEQVLLKCDDYASIDLILLDIQMEEINGVELAKKLRQYNPALAIIFITGLVDYVYEGFQLQAINYLIKPFQKEQLYACLNRALEICKKEEYWMIRVDKELIRISLSDIVRIESDGHYLQIITRKTEYRIKMSMKEVKEKLQEEHFLAISRSDLIALEAIDKITTKEVILINGDCIRIPKGKHKEISDSFIQYHFHKGTA